MVASDTTRMLVLGVAKIFEPANGYQLRRELLSWNVQDWANVNPGSIYSMLTTLTKQGMLVRKDVVVGTAVRPVAVYVTTPAGRKELLRLVKSGLVVVNVFDQSAFYAALSLMAAVLGRAAVITQLDARHKRLTESIAETEAAIRALDETKSAPPHVAKILGLAAALPTAERAWLAGFIADIRAGAMIFQHDPGGQNWDPLPNDPAWRMGREREEYLKELQRSANAE